MQVILDDNTRLGCIVVYGRKEHYQNATRDVLEFHFSPDHTTFEELEELFGDESKTSKIIIVDENEENLHEHYVIRKSLSLKQVEVAPETPEAPAQHENRYVVEMAQMSYVEQKLAQQERDIAELFYLQMLGGLSQ